MSPLLDLENIAMQDCPSSGVVAQDLMPKFSDVVDSKTNIPDPEKVVANDSLALIAANVNDGGKNKVNVESSQDIVSLTQYSVVSTPLHENPKQKRLDLPVDSDVLTPIKRGLKIIPKKTFKIGKD